MKTQMQHTTSEGTVQTSELFHAEQARRYRKHLSIFGRNISQTALLLSLICLMTLGVKAQSDSLEMNPLDEELIRMENEQEDSLSQTAVQEPDSLTGEKKDTVRIRVGNRAVEIISGNDKTFIDIERIEDFKSKWEKDEGKKQSIEWDEEIDFNKKHSKKKHHKKFNGHWAGLEFGGNMLMEEPTSFSPHTDFLATRPEKSYEVNWNFYEYNFGFCPYVGIVTGLGFNFNDYKFKYPYTLAKDAAGIIQPVELSAENLELSKLSTGYLTAPLMLEFQIPGYNNRQRFYVSAGIIGGIKMGDHTKVVIDKEKTKDKGDHNISPVRWGYTARVGFDDFGLFATFYNTPLFEKDKGPVAYPATIGIAWSF